MKFRPIVFVACAAVALSWLAACNRNRQEAVVLANRGDQMVELDPTGAIGAYEQAVKLDPTSHRIFHKLAKAYAKKEEWDKVAQTMARATSLAPTYANYWFERGHALQEQAKKGTIAYKESIEPLKQCVEQDKERDECYSLLGHAYLNSDDEQKAVANFSKAIEHGPDKINYYARLGDLYFRLNEVKAAEQVLQAAKTMAQPGDPDLFGIHVLLSQVFQDKGALQDMVAELESAKTVAGKDHPEILFNLGSTYATLNPPRKQEALTMLKSFSSRACRSRDKSKYQVQCEQAATLTQKLQGAGAQ